MNRQELRTLRSQLLLLAALLAGCTAAAAVVASQRAFFEGFIEEKYAPLPAALKPLADAAADGQLDPDQLDELSEAQRLALYDDWITRADPLPAATPRALVAVCPALYIARAERTLVCGNAEQRKRALKFIEWAGSPKALAVLHRARLWAAKRKQTALIAAIVQTIHQLEGTPHAASAGEGSESSPALDRRGTS